MLDAISGEKSELTFVAMVLVRVVGVRVFEVVLVWYQCLCTQRTYARVTFLACVVERWQLQLLAAVRKALREL